MMYYPVLLNVEDRPCLVVGGGGVGERKVKGLLECKARVTLVSPAVTQTLSRLEEAGRIRIHRRGYETRDLDGMFLVMGATDNEPLNRRIHAEAEERGLLCNIADRPALCRFILPSVIRRGDLVIATSTSGKSPAFARHLRKTLEAAFGPAYGPFLTLMGNIRQRLLAEAHAPEAHKPLFEALIQAGLLALVERGDVSGIDRLLLEVLGEGFRYETLMQEKDRAVS